MFSPSEKKNINTLLVTRIMIIDLRIILPKKKNEHICKSQDDEAKWMHFLIEHEDLLKTYNGIESAIV